MQEAVGKTSQRLALEQRRQAREDIFARNRRYLKMAQMIKDQDFKVFRTRLVLRRRYQTSHPYKTLIEALARRRYDRTRIMEYVGLLWNEEIVRVYEGIVALLSLGQPLVSINMEEQFFGSGVVPRLVVLAHTPDHPFVQQKSIELLQQMVLTISRGNLDIFFNLTTIPLSFFIESIRLSRGSFIRVISLLSTLNNRLFFIIPSNSKMQILDLLDQWVSNCLTSNEAKETAVNLASMSQILNAIKVYFLPVCIRFTDRLYEIKRRIVAFYRQWHFSQEIYDQILQVYKKQKIAQIANGISQYTMQTSNVANYIRDLLDAGVEANFTKSTYAFSSFISALINIKKTRCFLSPCQLIDRIGQLYRSKFRCLNQPNDLDDWIRIIADLLNSGQNESFELFLHQEQIPSLFGKLYEKSDKMGVIWALNGFVRALVTHSSKEGAIETLCKYNFIEKYFKNGCRFNRLATKEGLKSFMLNLSGLKENSMPHYETIRRLVVHENNYAVILEKKPYLANPKNDDIFKFYEKLKEEEIMANRNTLPITEKKVEGSLIEYKVAQVFGESDGPKGQILLGDQPICNRCLRHHARG